MLGPPVRADFQGRLGCCSGDPAMGSNACSSSASLGLSSGSLYLFSRCWCHFPRRCIVGVLCCKDQPTGKSGVSQWCEMGDLRIRCGRCCRFSPNITTASTCQPLEPRNRATTSVDTCLGKYMHIQTLHTATCICMSIVMPKIFGLFCGERFEA